MWSTYFYTSAPTDLKDNIAAIFKINSFWNDFGYKFQAGLRIKVGGFFHDFSVRLLPFKADVPQLNAEEWIEWFCKTGADPSARPVNKEFPLFVIILSSVDQYKKMYSMLGEEGYESLLCSVNEINAMLDKKSLSAGVYDKIIDASHFSTGFIREPSYYMAFRFGYYSARRVPPPQDSRVPFSFSVQLPGFVSPHKLNIDYVDNDFFADRVHCLIGVNGCGKTRLLKSLICALSSSVSENSKVSSLLYDCNDDQVVSEAEDWSGELPSFSRVIAYSSDPHNVLPRKVSINGPFEYIYSDMGLENAAPFTITLADLIRSGADAFVDNDSRFTLLKKTLQQVIPLSRLLVPLKDVCKDSLEDKDGKIWIPIGAIRGGEQHKLNLVGLFDTTRDLAFQSGDSYSVPLSSGQKMFFRFVTHFLSYMRAGTLIIIDEPETHLHPNLITEFMSLLYSVLAGTSSVAIIATHSAYVAREAPSHCVHVVKQDEEGAISVGNIYGNTLGANISFLSNFVFGDPVVESFNSKIAKVAAQSGAGFEEIVDKYSDLMSVDMLMRIKEIRRQKQ